MRIYEVWGMEEGQKDTAVVSTEVAWTGPDHMGHQLRHAPVIE